jgi:hypothetical protein
VQQLVTTSKQHLQCFSAEEAEIAKVKYLVPCFKTLPEIELVGYVQGIVKRVKVITGWAIPELQEDRLILYSEMAIHFKEKWSTYNAEEVIYAIRNYSGENYGKDINLKLIDEAMDKYASIRAEISRKEEQEKNRLEFYRKYDKAYGYDAMELVQTFYNDFLANTIKLNQIPARVYEIIKERCKPSFTEEQKKEFTRRGYEHEIAIAEGSIAGMNTVGNLIATQLREKLSKLKEMAESEYLSNHSIRKYALALATVEWFESQKQQGITDLTKTYGTK